MNFAKSQKYWEETAQKQKKLKESLTHSDRYLPQLETSAILSYISSGDSILEIGCGACDNSIPYIKKCKNYTGVELIQAFVELGRKRIREKSLNNAEIIPGDGYLYVLNKEITQDVLVTQRFIINLKDRDTQLGFFRAIRERNRGRKIKLIICEGFEKELRNLNKFRKIAGLEEIRIAEYNNFLDYRFLRDVEEIGYRIVDEVAFNTYFLITRLFNNNKFAKPGSEIAKIAFSLEKEKFIKIDREVSYSKIFVLEI
ncbi:MAG: class I SAM-dependent methyltransferase [Candidatus Aminicenantes bacterium]|nr:class I SAM-dependent methyltransferase [Candidatus Aminicenantes bacterium]